MRMALITCVALIGCGDAFRLQESVPDGGEPLASSDVAAQDQGFSTPDEASTAAPMGEAGPVGKEASAPTKDASAPTKDAMPAACTTGAQRCDGVQRQSCAGGVWFDNGTPCPGWCVDGTCVACQDTPSAAAACPTGTFCNDGVCARLCCRRDSSTVVACSADDPWTCSRFHVDQGTVQLGACTTPSNCDTATMCGGGAASFTGSIEVCL